MYKITFSDGELWQGNEPENSNWNKMPLKPIKSIAYTLLNHTVSFEGYEQYNHLVEKAQFILNDNKIKISKVILMAKKNNVVYSFVFDCFSREITPVSTEYGKEYYGKATTGWKEGLQNTPTRYNITKNKTSD